MFLPYIIVPVYEEIVALRARAQAKGSRIQRSVAETGASKINGMDWTIMSVDKHAWLDAGLEVGHHQHLTHAKNSRKDSSLVMM